jgi:hypothetical protein
MDGSLTQSLPTASFSGRCSDRKSSRAFLGSSFPHSKQFNACNLCGRYCHTVSEFFGKNLKFFVTFGKGNMPGLWSNPAYPSTHFRLCRAPADGVRFLRLLASLSLANLCASAIHGLIPHSRALGAVIAALPANKKFAASQQLSVGQFIEIANSYLAG